jgi:hypothetical protein
MCGIFMKQALVAELIIVVVANLLKLFLQWKNSFNLTCTEYLYQPVLASAFAEIIAFKCENFYFF